MISISQGIDKYKVPVVGMHDKLYENDRGECVVVSSGLPGSVASPRYPRLVLKCKRH